MYTSSTICIFSVYLVCIISDVSACMYSMLYLIICIVCFLYAFHIINLFCIATINENIILYLLHYMIVQIGSEKIDSDSDMDTELIKIIKDVLDLRMCYLSHFSKCPYWNDL